MGGSKVWHLIYGGGFAVLLAVIVLAAATNPHSLWQEFMKGVRDIPSLEVDGLPILLGMFAVFSILERLLPAAGPRKPLRGYWLNFKVTVFELLIGPTIAGLTGAFTIALGNRLGL